MRRISCQFLAVTALSFLFLVAPAQAGPIGIGGFGSPTIEHFTGLGLPFNIPPSLTLSGVTYSTGDTAFRYFDWNCCGSTLGEGLGTNDLDVGSFIDVTFGSPVARAGGFMVISYGTVDFFGPGNVLLGTVNLGVSGSGAPPLFAGWQDSGGITRIRFTDLSTNGQITVIDDIYSEGSTAPVPEPATLLLVGSGVVAALRRRSRKVS